MQALWGEPERVCGCCSWPCICGPTNDWSGVRPCDLWMVTASSVLSKARFLRSRSLLRTVLSSDVSCVSRSLLHCIASSHWAVDCAARRALSLTLRLANRASLSSALSKAQFLRSRSLLQLSLASLLACTSVIHVHVQIEVKG